MKPFSETLKEFRERAGLSQSKLADRAGYDHSYVSRLESNQRQPTREAVTKLYEIMRAACDDITAVDYQKMMEAAGFRIAGTSELPPSDADIARVLSLLGGALRDDLTASQDKHTLIRSVRMMLDGITYKEIA